MGKVLSTCEKDMVPDKCNNILEDRACVVFSCAHPCEYMLPLWPFLVLSSRIDWMCFLAPENWTTRIWDRRKVKECMTW